MKRVIIIGASSGIGRALARLMLDNGYTVGLVARREKLLEKIKDKYGSNAFIKPLDITDSQNLEPNLSELINEMNGCDTVIVSSGIGFINYELNLEKEVKTIKTNVNGFTHVLSFFYKYFERQKKGHIVGITSVAAILGVRHCPAYNASKAYQSNYLEGLRHKSLNSKHPINITEVRPGYVDTKMAQGDGLFWVASPEKAAMHIYRGVLKKKYLFYVSRRWFLIGLLLNTLPKFIYKRL